MLSQQHQQRQQFRRIILLFFFLYIHFFFNNSLVVCDSPKKVNTTPSKASDWKPTTVLVISQTNLSSDCTLRSSTTINGTSPGPELRYKPGQRVWIRVINELKDDLVTMHFHGLAQQGSPWSDGTIQISQYGIPPNGGFFDYEFECQSAGTYIYHLHAGFKVLTAYGAFIIEDDPAKMPYKYDEERTLMLADYYHATDKEILAGLNAKPLKFLGEPQSLLVNGQALGVCNATSPAGCTKTCHHHTLVVEPSRTYRIRAIGITSLTYLYFAIEGHQHLKIIQADAGYVKQIQTAHFQVGSGERYDFILETKSRSALRNLGGKKDFYGRVESRYRAKRDVGAFILRYKFDENDKKPSNCVPKKKPTGKESTASSQAGHSDETNPSTTPILDSATAEKLAPLPEEGERWVTPSLEPFDESQKSPQASEVTRRIFLSSQQKKLPDGTVHWYLNNSTYTETQPHIPYLIKAYTTGLKPNYEAAAKNNGYDKELNAYPIKLGEVIEFVIINLSSTANVSEAHPWHFHGKTVSVIAQGYGEFSDERLKRAEKRNNGVHVQRDTQVILAGKDGRYFEGPIPSGTQAGWMVVRLRAEDPGAFLVHCHLQVHAIMGMAIVILIGIEHLPPLPADFLKTYISPGGASLPQPKSYFDAIRRPSEPEKLTLNQGSK